MFTLRQNQFYQNDFANFHILSFQNAESGQFQGVAYFCFSFLTQEKMTLLMFVNTYLVSLKLFKKKLLPYQLVHISLQFYQMVAQLGRLVQTKDWLWSMLKEVVRLYFLCG